MRVPTVKQAARLSCLSPGTMVVNPRRNDWRPLLNHGWVEPSQRGADNHGFNFDGTNPYLPPLRITADGLRALADSIDKHGQPEIPERQTLVEAMRHPSGGER
jgi:hypothetical protein